MIGKKCSIDLYDERESNTPQYHIPNYDGKCGIIDEYPDDTTPVVTKGCENDEHEDSIRNYFIEESDT